MEPPRAWIRDTSVIESGRTCAVDPWMRCSNPSRIPITSQPEFTASIVAAEMTELIPGAGPPRTGSRASACVRPWEIRVASAPGGIASHRGAAFRKRLRGGTEVSAAAGPLAARNVCRRAERQYTGSEEDPHVDVRAHPGGPRAARAPAP